MALLKECEKIVCAGARNIARLAACSNPGVR
jgi:hypothetical protein